MDFKIKILFISIVVCVSIFLLFFFYSKYGKIKRPVCGNGICEYFETPEDCCRDCECWNLGEVCNLEKNRCEKREIKISDERIKEVVINYFEKQGKEVVSMEIVSLITWNNKLGKNIIVHVKGVEWFIPLIVTEDEEVIEFQS